jgi:hypothetical protein
MKPLETLTANKWYPLQNGKPLYPTPQSILRESVGAETYTFLSETVTTDHIRAAVVMPLEVPFQHLLQAVPWAMTYTTDAWRMIIVSTLDPVRWLTLARASGAKAWLKGHNMTMTYNWELPETDEHGLKKRPPNALGISSSEPTKEVAPIRPFRTRSDRGRQYKNYDKAALIADLQAGGMTRVALGEKYGLSRITVMEIAKAAGLGTKKNQHG